MNEDEKALEELLAEIEAEKTDDHEAFMASLAAIEVPEDVTQSAANTGNSEGKGRQTGEPVEPVDDEEEMTEEEERELIDRLAELEDSEDGGDDKEAAAMEEDTPLTDEKACLHEGKMGKMGASEEDAQALGGGNPYHAKDGKFTTAGGMKGKPAGPAGEHIPGTRSNSGLREFKPSGSKAADSKALQKIGQNVSGAELLHGTGHLSVAHKNELMKHVPEAEMMSSYFTSGAGKDHRAAILKELDRRHDGVMTPRHKQMADHFKRNHGDSGSTRAWAMGQADRVKIDTRDGRTADKLKAVLEYHGKGDFGSVFNSHYGTLGAFIRASNDFVPKGKRVAFMRDLVSAVRPKSSKASAGTDGAQTLAADLIEQVVPFDYLGPLQRVELAATSNDSNLPPDLRGKQLVQGKPVATFKLGINKARDGRIFVVDDLAVRSLLEDGNKGTIVPFTYTHEKGPEGDQNSGYIWKHAVMDGYLKAAGLAWTQDAAADLATGKRGPVSPDVYTQALDPETYEVLDRSSPLYAGPGKGMFGSPFMTNTFRPVRWRAVSLVGVPALQELPIAQLSAQQTSAPKAEEKEHIVTHEELCSHLGLDAEKTTPEQALACLKDRNQKATAAETASQQAAAAVSAEAQAALDLQRAAAATAKAEDDRRAAVREAAELIRQENAAQAAQAAIDGELLAAEKDGRIVAAKRPYWLAKFKIDAEEARQELASLRPTAPGETHWYETGANVESGGHDESLNVDRKPERERNAILSRATAWALDQGIAAEDYSQALAAVMGNDKEEAAFHRQVLASDPDWGKPHAERTGRKGATWRARMRKSTMKLHPEFDPDRAGFILQRMKAGAISSQAIPADIQQAALAAAGLVRQEMGGEASNFQPASRFMIPNLGFGIFQGEFGGSEIAPEFVGGANEEASYPITGNEGLRVRVNAAGVPEPIGRNAEDKPSQQRGYDFKKVTLYGYGNTQWVDRRDQAAGDAILPIGVMAQAAADSLAYGRAEKELIQAAFLRDTTNNYATGFFKDMSAAAGRQWNDPNSTPIQDYKGARMAIWRAVGTFPELGLMGPDVVETLSFHPQILLAAREAGISHIDRPMAYAPLEMLASIFGSIVTPTCRISTAADGSAADTPWAQDVILSVISRGKPLAPRAFATVVSGGYPVIRTLVDEKRGLRGSDGADFADMYAMERVGPSATKTSSAYCFVKACAQLTVVA